MSGAFFSKRNLLFDLDGTLVNSTPAHARAFIDTLKDLHHELAKKFNYSDYAGRPTREVFKAIGFVQDVQLDEMTERKQQFYREAVDLGEVEVFPGALDLLAQLRKADRLLYLVTSASQDSTQRILNVSGLDFYFQGITTAQDTPVGKPAPDPYLHTLARYKLNPADCLVIEDSESGVKSARCAGLDTVLINSDLPLPDVTRVKDFGELATLLLP